MSLNWNAEKVPSHVRTQHEGEMTAAIWVSIVTGVPDLTETTVKEAMIRTKMLEEMVGPYLVDNEGNAQYLWPKLPLLIGLRTNASRKNRTRFLAEFMARQGERVEKAFTAAMATEVAE